MVNFYAGQAEPTTVTITPFAIGHLKLGQCRTNSVKTDVRAEIAVNVGQYQDDYLRRQNGIPHHQIFVHGKPRPGIGGNDMNPCVLLAGIDFAHLLEQSIPSLGHRFRTGRPRISADGR